jgi:uncharacterized protein
MAVIVKYIVVRNGEEKMTFATKKEADAYDKMLDIADNLFEFLENSDLKLSEDPDGSAFLCFSPRKETPSCPFSGESRPKKQGHLHKNPYQNPHLKKRSEKPVSEQKRIQHRRAARSLNKKRSKK